MAADEIRTAYPIVTEEEEYISFRLIPERFNIIEYYHLFFRRPKYLLKFWNSMILTVPIVCGQTIIASSAAFAFAKLRFPFKNTVFFIYIIVMMMPFQVTLVPNYIMLKDIGLVGTYWAVILPGVFTTFGVFLLRQFMVRIPNEYIEAGKIDGAPLIKNLISIVMPQCKMAISSLIILVFVDYWNMVEQPIIFLEDESMFPLSVYLTYISENDVGIAFACGVVYLLPAVFLFTYSREDLVRGIRMSGIK
jgi:multiple sugar transport system permease protein